MSFADLGPAIQCVRAWERCTLPYGWSLSMPGDGAVYGRGPDRYGFRRHPLGPPRDSLAADAEALSEAWGALALELVKALRLREVAGWMTRAIERVVR